MRWLLFVVSVVSGGLGVGLVACTRPSATMPQRATWVPPPETPAPFVQAPEPEPARAPTIERYSPRDLVRPSARRTREELILLEGRWRKPVQPIDIAEIDFLSRCAREFVQAQPENARRVLVDAFTHYATKCDRDGKVVLEHPLGFDSHDRKTRSDVALVGTITPRGSGTWLRVSACGADATFDRVTLIGDRQAWTSPRLEVRRDPYGCEVAELPYTRTLAEILRRAVEDDSLGGSLVRFEGSGLELTFSEAARDELRSVLDAIDAITVP